MEFGSVDSVEGVDLSLPPDDPRLGRILPGAPAPLRLWVGAPIIGAFESGPGKPRAPRDGLPRYAARLDALELNATFYAVPTVDQVRRWREQVPEHFRFCAKVPQGISRGDPAELGAFASAVRHLGPTLGTCFLQLPPAWGPDDHPRLVALTERWPPDLPLAIELRHPGWFARSRLLGRVFELMTRRGFHAVITDTPGRRDVCHVSLTTPSVMLRFTGHRGHPSDLARRDAWMERLARWGELGLRQAWVFVHQPDGVGLGEMAADWADAARGRLVGDLSAAGGAATR